MTDIGGIDAEQVAFAGVAGQARLLADGTISAADLVEVLLARIGRLDPRLNAFRAVFFDEARAAAQEADRARRAGDRRPLLGVPIAVKDTIAVAGHPPTFGTGSPQLPRDSADDEVVRRLRSAGAILLGFTNLPELALWAATESEHHGVTRNPWDPTLAPGGSSGGSAAAVAAGLVAGAHATDGLGSIRIPAAACGLVGLKPTHGTVPLGPDPEHWAGLSHAGFVTRSVADTAALLDATTEGGGWTDALVDRPRLRIAVSARPAVPARVSTAVRDVLRAAEETLRDLGHEVRPADPPYGAVSTAATTRYLAGVAADVEALADPEATERRTRALAGLGRQLPAGAVDKARAASGAFAERMAAFFADVDVLLTPTLPGLPPRAGSSLGRGLTATLATMAPRASFTSPWNAVGLPAVSVPFGTTPTGLPVGLQLVGPATTDRLLLALAAELEERTGWLQRRPPLR